jgi:hypothetical protein
MVTYICKIIMFLNAGSRRIPLDNTSIRIVATAALSVIVVLSMSAINPFIQNISAQQRLLNQPDAIANCKPLSITNTTAVLAASDTISIFGIISNPNSTEPMNEIRIVGEFYDLDNNLIGVESTSPELSVVPVGQSSPFKILTTITNDTLDHYNLTCGIR